MKKFIFKNSLEANFKNSNVGTPSSISSQNKPKNGELNIDVNNENISPNSGNSKSKPSFNFPLTTKNLFHKIKEFGNNGNTNYSSNSGSNTATSTGRNSEGALKEKKLKKLNSLSELNRKKLDSKCFHSVQNKENVNLKKEENRGTIKANLERVKISHKNFGVIENYAAITTEGLYR
jgi:hypothetical protein